MKIVVLDGYALNPGDLSWAALQALGECTVHERTPAAQAVMRAAGAPLLLTNKTVLGRAEMAQLPELRYIGVLATGYNVVDVRAASERGIVVTNVPAYSTRSVAQMVFALVLEHTQRVGQHSRLVHEGAWCRSPDFAFWVAPLAELEGKTMGIVGLGRIGMAVAELAHAFGMHVVAAARTPRSDQPEWVRLLPLDEVFRQADVLSLHCPLTAATERLVNAERLRLLKPTAFLVNTSRGGVVDEAALASALRDGRLGGAGLDVLSQEPPAADCPLLGAPNCLITPHIGWATREARERLLAVAVANLRAFLAGQPVNVVRPA
jgi:glycerate dehydrogenase